MWKEFTLARYDSHLNTSMYTIYIAVITVIMPFLSAIIYATVMILHKNAETHHIILHEIDKIVLKDMNNHLWFKHIHFDDDVINTQYVSKKIIVTNVH
jgi:hypothetical protein